jgi:hypothetical protein
MLGTILLVVGGLICAALAAAVVALFFLVDSVSDFLDRLPVEDDRDANP